MQSDDSVREGPVSDEAAWAVHGFHREPADLVAERSLPSAWVQRWRREPAAAVLHEPGRPWVAAAELGDRTALVAARFAAAGLVAGDRILMSAAPSVDLVVAHVAALRLGLVVVPVNTGFAPNEIANVTAGARPRLAVLDDPGRVAEVPTVYPAVELPDGPVPALDTAAATDPALLVFTSGTTGVPKGALLSHGNLLASAQALVTAWHWEPDDRLVLALPLFHMHGLGVGVHGTLLAGASATIVPRFTPEAVVDAASEQRATLFFGVPTMYVRLLASPRSGELSRLRLCVSGSAPLAADVWTALEERIRQRVIERYGMTETIMNVSNPYDGDRRPGSVGLALPGVQVRLHRPGDDGIGEIVLQGPNVFAGYWERPDATADAFDAGGWFHSGDLGRFDADGYLRIVGRSKDLIITGGYIVYPRDVEEVLLAHPAVADVAVVGEPSDEWGETVTACVVAAGTVTADALLAHASAGLAGYQRPRRVVFVDDLPRNALGKVVKADLLAALAVSRRDA
jgi:malonyl-CoA/methylmalonyl-CoA synthetase